MHEQSVLKTLHLVFRLQTRLELSDYESLASGAGQARILEFVLNNPGIRQIVVTDHLGLDSTTVSQAVRRLVECHYLERERDPRDRRRYLLRPGAAARSLKKLFRYAVEDRGEIMLKGLTPDDHMSLKRLLSRVAANIAAELQERGVR